MSQQSSIAVSGADYFFAHEITRHLLKDQKKNYKSIVAVVEHQERAKELEVQGAEIRQASLDDENALTKAYQDIQIVWLCPPPTEQRLQRTERIIKSLKAAKVQNIILHSLAAAEAKQQQSLREFQEIENLVKQSGINYVILRNQWCINWLHLLAPAVQEKGSFPIPLQQGKEFYPIHVVDIARASQEITKGGVEKHKGQVYLLNGPERVDAQKLVEELNRAVSGSNAQLKTVSDDEFEQYLSSLRNKKIHPGLKDQPTDVQIKTLTEMFEWINSGEGCKESNDLKKIIGNDGTKVQTFFKDHAAEFRGRENRK